MGKYKEATYKIILFLYKGNTSAGKVFMITDFFPIYKTLIHHPAPFRFLFLLKKPPLSFLPEILHRAQLKI